MKHRLLVTAVTLALCLTWAGAATAAEKLIPKVDNFIFFVDYSGSMGFKYKDTGEQKIDLAKQLVKAVNQEIPDLGYKGALTTFAPYSKLLPAEGAATPHVKSEYEAAVDGIFTDYSEFARLTPMTSGLDDLEMLLKELPGKTAVIMVSDGEHNLGDDPVQTARDIYNRYPGSVCFHVISMAETAEGQAILDGIAALRDCSVTADGGEMLGSQPMVEQFTKDVFYDVVMVEEPKPKPEPKPEPKVEEVISLRNVQFDFDKSNIRADMQPILDEAASIIKDREGDLMLEGHTCNIGADEYNMGLGKRRADSVKDYLVKKGVDANRLETKSYGESQPKYTNDTNEGRSLNRRVELRFK